MKELADCRHALNSCLPARFRSNGWSCGTHGLAPVLGAFWATFVAASIAGASAGIAASPAGGGSSQPDLLIDLINVFDWEEVGSAA